MSLKKIVLFLVVLVFFSECVYKNQYLKSYRVGGKYRVKTNENMIEFKYAQVRELDSGIAHVLKLREQQRIVFGYIKKKKLFLRFARDFENGKYVGASAVASFDVAQLPKVVQVHGFKIRINKYGDDFLSYQILAEPDYLDDGSGIFGSASAPATSSTSTPSKKNKGKGLAF